MSARAPEPPAPVQGEAQQASHLVQAPGTRLLRSWPLLGLGAFFLLVSMLFALQIFTKTGPWYPVSLHSILTADYSADPLNLRIPAARIDLLRIALLDQASATPGMNAPEQFATLQSGLQTTVPTITPRPGSIPPSTATRASPAQSATPSSTGNTSGTPVGTTPSGSASPTPEPSGSPTPTNLLSPTPNPGLTTTPPPTATRRPGTQPAATPTRAPTKIPPNTPTSPAPTATKSFATPTARPTSPPPSPTSTRRPYPAPTNPPPTPAPTSPPYP